MEQRIDLHPEDLMKIANEFSKASQNGQSMIQGLNTIIEQADGKWEGQRQQEFYSRIHESLSSIKNYLNGLQEASAQLQRTATHFQNADQSR